MKKIFYALCLIVLVGDISVAQSNNYLDVKLSINLANNIIQAESTTSVAAEIKNSSTNIIYLAEVGPVTDFDISLTNDSGKNYRLTSNHSELPKTLRLTISIMPGESRDWIVPISISKDVEPGEYTLQATRGFTANGSSFELESNLLKVQVK